MQYSFLRMESFTHSKTLQTSTNHNKLTIGTKTKHLKKQKKLKYIANKNKHS